MDVEKVGKIRDQLKNAWVPFFTRFGRLVTCQVETIPKVLKGSNVVVASPTASGKTESVLAPVAERFVKENWQGLAVLYVVPTRALANDAIVRIQGPLNDMGIKCDLRHGDKPYLSWSNLPNLLVTTPESLDSLICRKPQIFEQLRTVILDEIHLVDNTYRGDQLRLLIWRLKNLAKNANFNVHLLSGTLSSPDQVGQRYTDKYEVVTLPGSRDIHYCFVSSLESAIKLAKTKNWQKILIFCNRRASVEEVAGCVYDFWRPYPVVAHHGSLSKQSRKEAESVMREAKVAACVATSTLEVGIDIGDIDLVVLAEPPLSVSSLLQRIGRGNRRNNIIQAAAICNTHEEMLILEKMFEVAKSGKLPEEIYVPDLSVTVQQIFSFLFQSRQAVSEEVIAALVSPLCENHALRLILNHLHKMGYIEGTVKGWVASAKLSDLGEKGKIHSNIPDDKVYKVIDLDSGKEVGSIQGVFDNVFVLAGRIWRVVLIEDDKIKVRPFKGKALPPSFGRRKQMGAFYWLLPAELRVSLGPQA